MPDTAEHLHCWIYRSLEREQMYLYLREANNFDLVPIDLLRRFGTPDLVMSLQLHPGRRLARADVVAVLRNLHEQGFYLQMPARFSETGLPEYRPRAKQ